MVTIPVVHILLLLVFRTAIAAAVPLILGACSIAIATGLIAAIGSVVDTSTFALNVASMIGLGLAIDFSLVVVSRFRQELAAGHGAADAVAVTLSTAGHSIAYSGITVTLSMLVMTALMHNLMIVRSMSMAVALVVLTGLAAALTLLPALLALLGVRIELFRVLPRRERRPDETGAWYRISGAIMARPWLWLGLSLALLAAIALPVRDMRLGLGTADSPTQTQAYKGFEVLTAAFGPSRAAPIQVVLHAGRGGVFAPDFLIGLKRLTRSFPVSSSSGPTRRWWAGKRCDSWTLGTRSTAAFRCWSPWWWS
jgi:RND superfamily putative drug exporter